MMQRKAVEAGEALHTLANQIRLYKKWNPTAFRAQCSAFLGVRGYILVDDMPCGHVVKLVVAVVLHFDEEAERLTATVTCPQCGQHACELSLWPPVP